MAVDIRENSGVLIIQIEGPLDLSYAGELKKIIDGYLERQQHCFLINLSKVTSANILGLGILVAALKKVRKAQGFLALVSVNLLVQEVLDVGKIRDVFLRFEDESEALEYLYKDQNFVALLKPKQNERRYVRIPASAEVTCSRSFWGRIFCLSGVTKDISYGGFFLKTEDLYPEGTVLHMDLNLPGENEPLHLTVRVAWLAQKETHPEHYPGMGIEILHVSDVQRQALANFIDSAQ